VQKLRRMASEFQGQADELVREANLEEVRSSINEIRNFNIRGTLEKAVDTDGTIRRTFTEDPLKTDYSTPYTAPTPTDAASGGTEAAVAAPPPAPAFVPPAYAPAAPPAPVVAPASPVAAAEPPAPPAFVPPAEAPAQTQKS
jgi:sec-independent protein translocase protein TatB